MVNVMLVERKLDRGGGGGVNRGSGDFSDFP